MRRRSFLHRLLVTGAVAPLAPAPSAWAGPAAATPDSAAARGAVNRQTPLGLPVRGRFPLTADRTYLNTAGLGPSPQVVLDAVIDAMRQLETLSETGHDHDLWAAVKARAAAVLGCDAAEVALTRNTTEGVNIVCNGLPLQAGDEVITTTHEHVGNTLAWLARQRRDGIVVRCFDPDPGSAAANLERLQALVTPRTRVVSISHVTCSNGHVLPVEAIGQWAAAHGLWYFVDGAQAAGMTAVDVHQMGCHAYATSGHKWLLGPKGTGLLYVRRDMLDTIRATSVGAYSGSGPVDMMRTGEFTLVPDAQRYEYGTVNAPLVHGLHAALGFLLDLGLDRIARYDRQLAVRLTQGLESLGATVLSPRYVAGTSGIVTFRLPGHDYHQVQQFLGQEFGLRTRGVYEGGLDGVRIALHLFNTGEDVDQVLEGVDTLLRA